MNTDLARLERTLTLAGRAALALLHGDHQALPHVAQYVDQAQELSTTLAPDHPVELMEELELHLSGAQAALQDQRTEVLLPFLSDARRAGQELARA